MTKNPLTGITNNLEGSAAPDANDDVTLGFSEGSIWIDSTNEDAYVCIDNSVGAAKWLSQKTGTVVGG